MSEKVNFSFPKTSRLLHSRDFKRFTKDGVRRVGRYFCVDLLPSEAPRLGISASRRYGKAHERNRFKRLTREAFRHLRAQIAYDVHVVPRQRAKQAGLDQMQQEFRSLLL